MQINELLLAPGPSSIKHETFQVTDSPMDVWPEEEKVGMTKSSNKTFAQGIGRKSSLASSLPYPLIRPLLSHIVYYLPLGEVQEARQLPVAFLQADLPICEKGRF